MSHPNLQHLVTRLDTAVHRGGVLREPTIILMHTTDGDSARSSIEYLNTTTDKQASYHYLIDRGGPMVRMTPAETIAFHAGDSAWPNPVPATPDNPDHPNGSSINHISFGIAWANKGEPLTDAQLESACWLCNLYMLLHRIPIERVLGHYEVSPVRKTDPRPAIDMDEFRALLATYRRDA